MKWKIKKPILARIFGKKIIGMDRSHKIVLYYYRKKYWLWGFQHEDGMCSSFDIALAKSLEV